MRSRASESMADLAEIQKKTILVAFADSVWGVRIMFVAALVQDETADVSLSQVLLLGIAYVVLFGVSVYATQRIATRFKDLDVGYTQALWATVFKHVGSVAGVALLEGVPGMSLATLLILTGVVLPVGIYALLFRSTLLQAVVIWAAVLTVEVVAGVVLVLTAIGLGTWLDSKLDMPLESVPALSLASRFHRT